MTIDLSFNCRLDANGQDPDKMSPTLRRYHQILWSKPLPNGQRFDLSLDCPKPFLVHRSALGEFRLSSDRMIARFEKRKRFSALIEQLPEDLKPFVQKSVWPVCECVLFPANRIDQKATINGARGFHHLISDRFDLTVECIRRHYLGEPHPLAAVMARYASFLDLFGDFQGYVDFFLLQDLLDAETQSVRFFVPFDHFQSPPVPNDLQGYERFLRATLEFRTARGERMERWLNAQYPRPELAPN